MWNYNGEWYERKIGENVNIGENENDILNYYKDKMESKLAISNSIILNNLLK